MGLTFDELSALAGRHGNERIKEQQNMHAPLTGYLDGVKPGGRVDIINIKGEEIDSVTNLLDGGALPTAGYVEPAQGLNLPKFTYGAVVIPRGAVTLATGDGDGLRILFEEIDSCSKTLWRRLDRGLIKKTVATLVSGQAVELDAIALGASGTVTVADAYAVRSGTVLERRTSGGTYKELLKVTRVSMQATGQAHVLTVTRDILSDGNDDATAGDILYLRGAYAAGMQTLDEACDTTTAIYGHPVAENNWQGNVANVGGAFDVQDLRDLWSICSIRSGEQPDFTLMNSHMRQLYSDGLLTLRRFNSGMMDVSGGVEAEFEGKPIKIDENCPADRGYFVNKSQFKVATWKDFCDDGDGGVRPASDTGHITVGTVNFDYKAEKWGAHNSHIPARSGLGCFYGVTN